LTDVVITLASHLSASNLAQLDSAAGVSRRGCQFRSAWAGASCGQK